MSVASEPARSPLRLTSMMRRCALAGVGFMVLAGCGSATTSQDTAGATTQSSTPSASAQGCSTGTQISARTIATADLDGDGTREKIDVHSDPSGTCPDLLSIDGGAQVELPAGEPPARSGFAVALPGRAGQLLVTRQDHPRGGFQLRVYAADARTLTELRVEGNSLLPFVALDVQEHPWSIECDNGGLVFTEAVAHQPHGFAAAWDIKQTTYAVEGSEVTAGPTKEIADNVLPGQLAKTYPALAEHSAFASCRAG